MTSIPQRLRSVALVRTLTACLLLAAAPAADAQSPAKVDPRALAMGGSFVAVADGWAALHWNPAGLWVSGRNEVAATIGTVPYEAGPWIESLRVVAGLSGSPESEDAAATLASDDAGLAADRDFGLYVASTRFGGMLQQITYVSEMSLPRTEDTEIRQAALRAREYQFSAAHPFLDGRLAIGGSAKLVQARGRYQEVPLDALSSSELQVGELLSAARSAPVAADDLLFSADVGVLFVATSRFRLGGVVKNVNAPALDTGSMLSYRLPRQIRVGGLLLPHPAVKVAFDFDVDADSFVEGMRERRELGGGVEVGAGVVAVRGGLFLDLNAIERRATYTFGAGFAGRVVRLDIAGSWAPAREGFGWAGAVAAEF